MKIIFYLVLLICFINSVTLAQVKNITLVEQDVASKAGASVTINLKNKDNIVAFAGLDKFFVSKDGGKTWTSGSLSFTTDVWGDPLVISDRRGDLYYFHRSAPSQAKGENLNQAYRLLCHRSKDGGQNWSDETFITEEPSNHPDNAWAVADPNSGRIYTSWIEFENNHTKDSTCYSNIFFAEGNGGKRWSEPVRINRFTVDCGRDHKAVKGAASAVGPDDQLYVAWSYKGNIYIDRSLNAGKNWLRSNILVTERVGGPSMGIPGVDQAHRRPELVCDNSESMFKGMLYLNWADQRNGSDNTDIWFMKSANYGDTWTSPAKVNDDISGHHQFSTCMAVDNTTGIIYIAYYDRRNYDDLRTDVYLAYSTDRGNSFVNKKISEKPFIPNEEQFFYGDISIAAHEGRVVPIWTRIDGDKVSVVTAVIEQDELAGIEMKGETRAER